MNIEKLKLDCPFCGVGKIDVLHIPESVRQSKSGEMSVPRKTKENYMVESGCSNCGKSQKEVERALKGSNSDVEKEKKIFERLKAQGIIKDEMTTKF